MKAQNLIPKTTLKFYSYLKKDFLLLYKRKKYLTVFILLPLIIASLFLFAMNPGDYSIDVGICNFDNGELSRGVLELNNFNPIYLDRVGCIGLLKEKIRRGELSLGIEIGSDFSKNLEELKQSRIVLYYDNTDVSFAGLMSWKVDVALNPAKREIIDELNSELTSKVGTIRKNINVVIDEIPYADLFDNEIEELDTELKNVEELDTEFLVNPIYVMHNPLYPKDISKDAGIVFIFPVLALFITLMLASTSIIYDKSSNFITRVKSSTSITNYLLAKLIFFVALTIVQFLIIFGLFLINGARYSLSFLGLAELIISIAIINSLIGFLIGLISENEGIAVLFSLIIAFPLMLLSGIFFPTQTLPKIIQWISGIMPLSFQVSGMKSVLLFGEVIGHTWLIGAGILFIICLWLFRKN